MAKRLLLLSYSYSYSISQFFEKTGTGNFQKLTFSKAEIICFDDFVGCCHLWSNRWTQVLGISPFWWRHRYNHVLFFIRSHRAGKSFHCHPCDKTFMNKLSYLYHTLQHTSETSLTCSTCCKVFNDLAALKKHQKSHRSGEKKNHTSVIRRFWSSS